MNHPIVSVLNGISWMAWRLLNYSDQGYRQWTRVWTRAPIRTIELKQGWEGHTLVTGDSGAREGWQRQQQGHQEGRRVRSLAAAAAGAPRRTPRSDQVARKKNTGSWGGSTILGFAKFNLPNRWRWTLIWLGKHLWDLGNCKFCQVQFAKPLEML